METFDGDGMTATLHLNETSIEAPIGATIFECADRLGVRIPTSCFKQGKCRECLVEVTRGMELLSPKSAEEKHLQENFRLSCRARVTAGSGDLKCHTLRRSSMRVVEETLLPVRRRLDPAVAGDGPLHGIAADIGTTTVVMRLVDLRTGDVKAVQSFENPQRFGGSDIMARIRYDSENPGRLLRRALLGYMKHAIEAFPCDPGTIHEVVVAGNTTMRDLFFGLSVHSVGQRPYRSLTQHELLEGKRSTTALSVPARNFPLPLHPNAQLYGLPLLGGHVGADAAACLLAVDLARDKGTVALMDIGTNTELLVAHQGKIFCASCPAGPAFEGGGLRCGMPALEGAVERVALTDQGVRLEVIGGGRPQGLCGSGLIDLLGELRRTGRMNEFGRLEENRFALDENVFIEEEDISQLAQAKGANMTGLRIVLEQAGTDFQELDRFYLAGGFARHIDVAAAKRIGLIPDLPDEKIVKVGNASIEGATLALLSVSARRELEEAARAVTHVELETHPHFFDCFVDACQFVPVTTHKVGRT